LGPLAGSLPAVPTRGGGGAGAEGQLLPPLPSFTNRFQPVSTIGPIQDKSLSLAIWKNHSPWMLVKNAEQNMNSFFSFFDLLPAPPPRPPRCWDSRLLPTRRMHWGLGTNNPYSRDLHRYPTLPRHEVQKIAHTLHFKPHHSFDGLGIVPQFPQPSPRLRGPPLGPETPQNFLEYSGGTPRTHHPQGNHFWPPGALRITPPKGNPFTPTTPPTHRV